jgi:protein Tex
MGNPIQVDLGRIAQDLQIRRSQVESVVGLLDDGNTVPFITRYRKEATGNLNEVIIGEIQLRVQRLRELAERKETILKSIDGQGKLTPDLAAAVRAADNPKRLEDLYLPFKPKKRSKASEAREKGLEPLAFRIWTRDETLTDLATAAQEFINAEKGLESNEKVLEGVRHILAEAISEMAAVRDAIRRLIWKTGKIVTAKAEMPEGQGLEYRDYFDYSEPVAQIPPHRVLAINRGDKEGPLKVRLELPRPEVEGALFAQLPLEGHPHGDLFRTAALDALDRLIVPSMEREIRRDLTDGSEKHAVDVFAKNLRSLLLQPPIPKQIVMAIDPGFRTGCKVAVLDRGGNLLDQVVVYPHPPQNRRADAKIFLKDLVAKHEVGVVAIGNGTACRETEELIAEIIAEGTLFSTDPEAAAAALEQAVKHEQAVKEQAAKDQAARQEQAARQKQAAAARAAMAAAGPPADAQPAAEPSADTNQPPDVVAAKTPVESAAGPEAEPAPEASADGADGSGADGQEAMAANNDHPATQPQQPSVAETPVGALPPISGGAPDSSEAEVETQSGSTAPVQVEHAAVVTDRHQPNHAEPAATEPHGTHHLTHDSAVTHEADSAAPGASAAPESESGSAQEAAAARAAHEEADAKAQPASGSGQTTKGDSGKPASGGAVGAPSSKPPLRGSRGGGRGKSDSSRNRSAKPRNPMPPQGPAPPQAPPRPHPADVLIAQLAYVVVNEAGASVYSTSQVGRDELPDADATLRSGISIGRRLQDPLAELVKIEPQNIGVGLYQHDMNPKQLKESLDTVISSCVNFVGVDVNTASVPLLRHVSGLNQLTARRIVDYRKEKGPFSTREQLQQIEGIGPATYTQAAGFLKIQDGEQPLDRTWVHPESYGAAVRLLEKLGYAPEAVRDKDKLNELRAKLVEVNVSELSRELETGEFTLRDIIDALSRPERDPRDDLPKPIFKKGILKIEDLASGMELKGTVLNVVDFGAFVDIGLKDSGLVHISQLANRYVKSPHDMVSVGDVVTVWVMGVDHERKRVSLTMVKPGTERQRGPQSGGRRGGGQEGEQGEGQQGQGRRGGGRAPRPTTSALTAPPVGAPSVAVLPDAVPRRNDRDRPGPGGPRSSDPRSQQGPSQGGPPHQEFRGGSPRPGGPGPPPGRGGPRGPYPSPNAGRPPRLDRGPADHAQSRAPRRPSAPPPPLSKDALEGNEPLRTFGQLKQLWEARTDEPEDSAPNPDASGAKPVPPPVAVEAAAPPPVPPQSTESASPVVNESDNPTASNTP